MSVSDYTRWLSGHIVSIIRSISPIALLAFGTGTLYLFVSVGFFSLVGPIVGVIIGSVLGIFGLIIAKFYTQQPVKQYSVSEEYNFRIAIILPCLYMVSVVVLFRFHTYDRPDLMYVLFGGYTGIIGYQIATGEPKHRIIPQVVVLGFFTYWSSQFLFPAGMFNPDTNYRYFSAIEHVFETDRIPSSGVIYAGHLGFVAEFALLSGLSIQTAYYSLATLALCVTVPLLGMVDRALPSITPRMCLYAAVVFTVMSWMIGRGMRPNKLNFFYPLILLIGIIVFKLYQSSHELEPWRWFVIGLVVSPAIIFGHQFSAGAALLFLLVIAAFVVISRSILKWEYQFTGKGAILPFVFIYIIGVIGNPIHQGDLLGRFTGLIASVFQSDTVVGAGGGPGRFSQLGVDILITATLSQLVLFSLAVAGSIWLIRQANWDYDFVLFWIGCVSFFLLVSILQNTSDTAPQRFYSLLGLFGFNLCTGALLYVIDQRGKIAIPELSVSINFGRGMVAVFLILLAVTSLASPIADRTNSAVSDDIPHIRHFETHQLNDGNRWAENYVPPDSHRIIAPDSDVSIRPTGKVTGTADLGSIESDTVYLYSQLSRRTGVVTSGGLTLGARNLRFVTVSSEQDGRIYTNGQTSGFLRQVSQP